MGRGKLARNRAVSLARGPPRTGGFYGDSVRRARGELKVNDIASGVYAGDTAGTVTLLNGIAQGDDFNNRTGRKITMKSIYIRGFVAPADDSSGPNLARLIVFYDSQSNGTTPTITQVLTASSSVSHLNLDNRDRFKILHDSQYVQGHIDNTATQSFAQSPGPHPIKVYIRIPKAYQNTTYNNTGATAGVVATGGLWMLTIGYNVTSLDSNFIVSTRLRFLDV